MGPPRKQTDPAKRHWAACANTLGNVRTTTGASACIRGRLQSHLSMSANGLGGREKDGYRNLGANADLNVSLSDAVSLVARGFYADGRAGFDGFPPPAFTLPTRASTR